MAQIVPLNMLYERFPAQKKRFNETVVIVHHYGGHKHSFRKHIDWLNALGYDCVSFDLPGRDLRHLQNVPIDKEWNFGLRFMWADAIETVLGSLPELKILYTFSFPSVSALMAMERRHCIDVKAWICDGGPFADVPSNFANLDKLDEAYKPGFSKLINTRFGPLLTRISMYVLGIHRYDEDAAHALKSLPDDFPILNVRCDQDPLVPPQTIQKFFQSAERLDLHTLELSCSQHLGGFKECPEEYQKTVQEFLRRVSTQTHRDRHPLESRDHR